MGYYAYLPDGNNFAGIGVSRNDADAVIAAHYADEPMYAAWKPVIAHGFDDNPEVDGDFPSFSNFCTVPVLSERAWHELRPLVGYCCEALPIVHPSGRPYFILHVMETIDCLDEARSEVKRFSDGRIMRVVRYFFKQELLDNKHIFKLAPESAGELIVDESFRRVVEENGLQGLLFNELPMLK